MNSLIFFKMPKHAQVSSDRSIFITSIAVKGKTHILLRQRMKKTPKDLLIEQEEISKNYTRRICAFRRIKTLQEKLSKYEYGME